MSTLQRHLDDIISNTLYKSDVQRPNYKYCITVPLLCMWPLTLHKHGKVGRIIGGDIIFLKLNSNI